MMQFTLKHLILLLTLALFTFTVDQLGGFRWAEESLVEARMEVAPRDASQNIVFVAIDHRSLRETAVWPWPRETYARLVTSLIDRGAAEIFLDIDLSTPSDAASDALLAKVLSEAGGQIILPVFRQKEGTRRVPGAVAENQPLEEFRQRTWLASVNIPVRSDGRVWSYSWGEVIDGTDIASAASVLSGRLQANGPNFAVNFAIAPSSVPVYSAIDVLSGHIAAASLTGKSVVIGAEAAELRANVNVPVNGLISGSMLHILAAETLLSSTELVSINIILPFLLIIALSLSLTFSWLGAHPFWLGGVFIVLGIIIEIAAFLLQSNMAFILSTPILHAALIGIFVIVASRELNLRQWLLQGSRIDAGNSRNVLQQVINDSSDAIIIVDESGTIIEISKRVYEIFGPRRAADWGQRLDTLLPPQLVNMTYKSMEKLRTGQKNPQMSYRLDIERNGLLLHLDCFINPSRLRLLQASRREADFMVVACVTIRDVTLAHQQKSRLDYLARFDTLTGACNRTEFLVRLSEELESSGQVIFAINLHRFKTINATLGREVGDNLLQSFLIRIKECDSRIGIAGRLGGDVFILSCQHVGTETVADLTNRLLSITEDPFIVEGITANVSMRMGIAFAKKKGDAALVVEQAELALDVIRGEAAGQGFHIFEPAMSVQQERSRQIERALWSAIANDEFYIAYQPQVKILGSRIIGAEALIRWCHPVLGEIYPSEFVPIAESSGFITNLGRWVMEKACRDAADWPVDIQVSVNVSPLQFRNNNLVSDVRQILDETGLSPDRLCLEITESLFINNSDKLIGTLADLRSLGICMALDDFGAGFSSFAYLENLPIDKLKMDRIFTAGLLHKGKTAAIILSIVTLCRELGVDLICEGVETAEQGERLSALGCHQAQGYFFGRPQLLSDLRKMFPSHSQLRISSNDNLIWH